MNQIGQQLRQFAIPAALGYAAGKYSAGSNSASTNRAGTHQQNGSTGQNISLESTKPVSHAPLNRSQNTTPPLNQPIFLNSEYTVTLQDIQEALDFAHNGSSKD